MTERVTFSLWQDGIEVASVDAPTFDAARREILHYARVYGQDGPCEIRGDRVAEIMAGFKHQPPVSGRKAANAESTAERKE